MIFRIVPDYVSNAINAKLDAAFAKCPDAERDRETLYQQLLDYFDEHGVVPDFTLAVRVTQTGHITGCKKE